MTDGLFGTGIAAPQLRQMALQPAGIPGSTFVRPAQKQVGGNLQALASALGNLNSALGPFAAKRHQEETDPNSDFNREWIAKRQQMTAEQLREEVKNNTAGGNLVRRDTIDVLLAERTNDAFRTKWTEFYNTDYDKTKGQFETEYERMRQEYSTLLPTEVAKGRFYQLTDTYKAQWSQEDQKQKIGLAQEYLGSAALSSFRTAIEDGRNVDGKSPDQIAQSVFRMSASNRDFAGMDGAQQNALLYQLAQEYALKGDVDIVRALLKGQRVGSDGKPLPALMETKSFTTDAIKLLQTAQEERSRVVKENGLKSFTEIDNLVRDGKFTLAEAEKWKRTGLLTDAQLSDNVNASENNRLQALANYAKEEAKLQARRASETQEAQVIGEALGASFKFGGIASIKDVEIASPTGDGTKTLTKSEIVKAMTARFEEGMQDQQEKLVAQGLDPAQAAQQTMKQKLAWYAGNRLTNEEWSQSLNSLGGIATIENLSERGNVLAEVSKRAELYRTLKAANPNYLRTLLTDDSSRQFLEAYDNAVTKRRMPTEDALFTAATAVANPLGVKAKSLLKSDRVDDMTTEMLSKFGLDTRSANDAYVRSRIEEMSMNGMTEQEVKDHIEQELRDTTVTINGMMIPDDRNLPEDFPMLAKAELEDAYKTWGKAYGLEKPEDLAIVPVSDQSKWQVIVKSTGVPLKSTFITPQTLDARRSKLDREHTMKVLELVKAKDAQKAEKQAIYDAEIRGLKDLIARYSRPTTGALGKQFAKYLQGVLDDRLARDARTRNMTEEQINAELDRIQKELDTPKPLGSWGAFDPAAW